MVIKVVEGAAGPIEFRPFDGESAVVLPSEEALAAFEQELGVSLPEAYRQFLLRMNGGKVSPRGFRYEYSPEARVILERFLDPNDEILSENETLFRYFLALGHTKQALDLKALQVNVRRWGREDTVGIGKTISGDILVLDLQPGPEHGSVKYMTIHGVGAMEDDETVPLAFVAADFDSFCRSFFDYDEEIDRRAAAVMQGGKH